MKLSTILTFVMKKDLPALSILLIFALASLGCGSAELEEEISTLKDDKKALEKEKADLEKDLEAKTTELVTATASAATLQTSIDELTTKLTGANGDVEFFTNQNAELEQQKGEIQEQLDAANTKIADLEQQLATAKTAAPTTTTVAAVQPATTAVAPGVPTSFPIAGTTPVAGGTTAPPPASTVISPDNPIVNPDASTQANVAISLFISAGGNNYPLANTEIYITEQQPNITKWGLHLKTPQLSTNELTAIQQSLQSCTIHKKVTTDASGQAHVGMLKAGTYWVSCGNPATPTGLQWSVQHSVNPGDNQLTLSNNNRAQ